MKNVIVVMCGCGRAHTAQAWAQLGHPPKGKTQDAGDGTRLVLRNCPCGSTRAISEHEDVMAVEILRDELAARMAWAHCRIALAAARLERALGRSPFVALVEAERHRTRAKFHAAERRLHAALLAGVYRARELRTPKSARGRRLELVGDAP